MVISDHPEASNVSNTFMLELGSGLDLNPMLMDDMVSIMSAFEALGRLFGGSDKAMQLGLKYALCPFLIFQFIWQICFKYKYVKF